MMEVCSNTKPRQVDRVLEHLRTCGTITAWEAMRDYGIMRLAARIHEIESGHGIAIDRKTVKTTNRFGDKIHFVRYAFAKQQLRLL